MAADQQALAQATDGNGRLNGAPNFSGEAFDSGQPRLAMLPESLATTNASLRVAAPAKATSFEAETAAAAGPPAMPTRRSPYSDIPSVYDMFVQATTPSGEPVRRFGESVFQNFRNAPQAAAGTIPIDFPASSDYVIGPGDGLTIDLWGGVSQRLSRIVDREGRVSLPEVGPVLVNGQSLGEVQQAVQRLLRTQFHDVSADVSLSRLRTVRVYVVGDVTHPGAYDVSSLSTALNALLAAGGPTAEGSLRVVKHYRGEALVQQVDLYDLLLRGVRSDAKRLEPGDTLQVAPVGAQIRVDGMVRRPAIYELHDETTLAQAIDLAGGMLPAAALTHIEVQRLEAHEKRTMLSLEISPSSDAAGIEQQMAAFAIRDRDEIHVFPIATFNQDAVYLQGHVVRAGRYSFQPGMTLKDLITSYADLLPEAAAKYAEIIRLNPPDYHPSVQSVDLAAVLSGAAAAPALAPLDTVRIFSRFDFENPPTVSVNGAVRRPGTYQTSGEIHFLDAVQLSGGVTPDAALDTAQVIRILPDSSLKILSVGVKEALAGDAGNNILLQPQDRILIQRNLLRADPPSLLVGGAVVNPGRYALTQNLRVADLVRISGGLKRGAEGDSADLTQFVVSDNAPLAATHVNVNLSAAMAGDPTQNLLLRDGDVLTIRQAPGWNDRSAAVSVQGEVKHPGTYGIRPGERLSSILQRAGGFDPQAYPYGAIFERPQVREMETKSREDMVLRVQGAENALALLPDTDPRQRAAKESAIQQWQSNLEQLNANPPVGRVAIRISPDIDRWKNTNTDIEVHAGDVLVIPKRPGYVMVSGQVFNATAISYRAGRSAQWYLSQAGGPTPLANKKAVFVVRADGSVMGGKNGMFGGDSLGGAVQPGDMVVVPEKALSGNVQWQNVLLSAQVAASIASTIYIAVRY
jgi:polysaccharide export outer membrane protein